MSEKLSHNVPEQAPQAHEAAELSRKNIERIRELAEQEKGVSEPMEALVEAAKQEALSGSELLPQEKEQNVQPRYQQKVLKQQAFSRTMDRVRSQLNPVEKQISKVMHQKTVEQVSNIGSRTLARPSGILGGGLFACLGSGITLYYAKHYGFSYNFSLFIILYLAGFVAGILLEFLLSKRGS